MEPMPIHWGVMQHGSLNWGDEFPTYDEAATCAKGYAERGTTAVVVKILPVARFVARVTVEEQVCDP